MEESLPEGRIGVTMIGSPIGPDRPAGRDGATRGTVSRPRIKSSYHMEPVKVVARTISNALPTDATARLNHRPVVLLNRCTLRPPSRRRLASMNLWLKLP